ncbi:MAG: alpha-L-rhamnosidase N-terminal domain-containing protein, partial [Chloroflexi bacterium]|nr:alpha-L-rhamnosidase N-terminal domain-containing protein [Chloroflexota bacterium]
MNKKYRGVNQLNFPPEAVWIGSSHPFDLHEAYLCFRSPTTWQLERKPDQAKLFITADSRYKLWTNGQFVGRGPGRSYPQHQCVDCLDLTAHLQAGANTLAVQVYQPGYSHFAYVHRGVAGLLAHLVCDDQTTLVTALTWRTRRAPSFADLVPRVSIYGSGVEERDLRLADDWITPNYDDSNWAIPRLVAPVGGYPWLELRLRAVPLLVERELPMTLLETRLLISSPASRRPLRVVSSSDAHSALRQGWFSAVPAPQLAPDETGWIKVNLAAGESAYWLFDLGRDYTCQGWADVKGAGGEEQLAMSYQEKIHHGKLVIS